MKKLALGIGGVLAILIALLIFNAARFTSKQLSINPASSIRVGVDVDAASSRLAHAIRFPTISGTDSSSLRDTAFDSLNAYLERAFPKVHTTLRKEVVNQHSLLYRWEGTNQTLNPLVLMAHLDVVPVEPGTEEAWDHPPFAGHIDNDYIWGRGALDNKNGVLGHLEAINLLVEEGYQPERSVILAYGHDEEIGGINGAKVIAERLDQEGIVPWLVLDEGGIVLEAHSMPVTSPLALIGIAEKGYLSLKLTVHAEGGHSSMPHQETAIGILSSALHRLSESSFPAGLSGATGLLFDYVGPEMSILYRTLFANRWLFGPVIVNQLASDPASNAVLRTTIAPTMLKGSPKDNVLPSQVEAVVNFRILPGESMESVIERVTQIIDDSRVDLSHANDAGRNPSVISSTESAAFRSLQETIHEIFPDALVAPYLVVGGTDAKHFSNLSPNVYRFTPLYFREGDLARMHGTNERVLKEDYGTAIQFYRQFILNTTGSSSAN